MPILFGVVLLDLIGFGIVIPILPFLSPELGADKMDIAYIIVVYAICSGLCLILSMDRHQNVSEAEMGDERGGRV